MKYSLLGSLLIFLLVGPFAVGQTSRLVRVGVSAEEYSKSPIPPNSTPGAQSQRDLLVSYLNKHEPDKKGPVTVEAIALTTMDPKGIVSEAREKDCDYVVEIHLSSLSPYPVGASESRWNYSPAEQPGALGPSASYKTSRAVPGGISYFIQGVRDATQPSSGGSSGAWRRQAAMSVMSSVYDAIIRAATP